MDFCIGGVVVEFFYYGFHMFSCCVVFIFPLCFFWSDVFFFCILGGNLSLKRDVGWTKLVSLFNRLLSCCCYMNYEV